MRSLTTLLRIIGVVFLAEVLVMLLLPHLGIPGGFAGSLWDAALLTLLCAGPLFLWVIRPTAEALKARDLRLIRYSIDNAVDGVFWTDPEARFLDVNEAGCRRLGYTREELLSMAVCDVDPDYPVEAWPAQWRRLQEKGSMVFESRHRTRDGRVFPVEITANYVSFEGDEFTCAFVRDITERKRAEEQLRLQGTALEAAANAIFITDAHGRIVWANRAVRPLTGYDPEEILGRTPRVFRSDRQDEAFYETLWNTVLSGRVWRGEIVNRRKDGSLYTADMTITPVCAGPGGACHFIAIQQDITAQKEAQAELRRAKEAAEAANRAKGEFLANMSHELRTPMNGIMGMTGILLDTDLDEYQRDCARTVDQCANSLLKLINDILDFSKIAAGKLEFENLDFDLASAVEDAAEAVAVIAHEKGIELVCQIGPEVPSALRGDPGRLRQVLINLANNAIKFTEAGEVHIRVILDSETDTHVTVRFQVRDTGIGIAPEQMDRLFESFSQADASTTRKYGGTGLGLAICKQLVELMDGRIGVQSTEGRGSTFWFTARFEKTSQGEAEPPAELPDLEALRVLIVDDNATNRKVLCAQLARWSMHCVQAAGGEEALTLLRGAAREGSPFDLAILDCMMPVMDGEELGRAIKADPALRDTVLIMLTSVGERGDAARVAEIGFAGYLTKPVKTSHLLSCILTVLGRPAAEQRSEAAPSIVTRHSLRESARRVRVLLAEDNVVNQKLAVRQLEKMGHQADVVGNGREAIEALGSASYDLILMDCQMPEMDGYEATREIRRREEDGHRIPIIAMTANAMVGDRERCLEAGMDDYLSKPTRRQDLVAVIEKWIRPDPGES